MIKKVGKKSTLNNSLIKAIPLSIAIGLLSAGTTFATEQGPYIRVDVGNGKITSIDTSRLSEVHYKAAVYSALKGAFENGRTLIVQQDDQDTWIDFGTYANEGFTYADMVAGDTQYAVDPDDHPAIYDL